MACTLPPPALPVPPGWPACLPACPERWPCMLQLAATGGRPACPSLVCSPAHGCKGRAAHAEEDPLLRRETKQDSMIIDRAALRSSLPDAALTAPHSPASGSAFSRWLSRASPSSQVCRSLPVALPGTHKAGPPQHTHTCACSSAERQALWAAQHGGPGCRQLLRSQGQSREAAPPPLLPPEALALRSSSIVGVSGLQGRQGSPRAAAATAQPSSEGPTQPALDFREAPSARAAPAVRGSTGPLSKAPSPKQPNFGDAGAAGQLQPSAQSTHEQPSRQAPPSHPSTQAQSPDAMPSAAPGKLRPDGFSEPPKPSLPASFSSGSLQREPDGAPHLHR